MTHQRTGNPGLPGRDELAARLAAMVGSQPRSGCPAVVAVGIDGYGDLVGPGRDEGPVEELLARMDRIVRRDDVVGWLAPDTLAVIGASLAPEVAGAVMDRLRSVFAMPIDLNGASVSLRCSIGIAFAEPDEASDNGDGPRGDGSGSGDGPGAGEVRGATTVAERLLCRAEDEMRHDRRRHTQP